ncbi:MAG: adenosylmethionine--8-amino-7-oxononanoate transaminase [Anaerohalosphaeraceae bacterium]|nr:adenosylmethionine--8-amino-7-oxononanoate transaminase [Anaerohalosphaeraceae bacterium]
MNNDIKRSMELDKRYIWHPFTQMQGWLEAEQMVIDSGDGFYLIDTDGNRYIDGISSLWCNVHGHRVKKIDDAIKDQLGKIAHSTLLGLGQSASAVLAEKLIEIAPDNLKKVFYSDSGATSVEIALKIAYQYYHNIGKPRKKFIALGDSYHGDTIGAVSVGGMELFHSIYKPMLFETLFAPSPNLYRFDGTSRQCAEFTLGKIKQLLKDNTGNIAAVIAEPLVQGAAGIIVHPKGFLKNLRELTKKYDTLLIVDEVATGFGKTGKMFACEVESVQPDIMCVAKGITGGYLPLAATLTTQELFDGFLGEVDECKTFYHGHTYTGNALACAAAIASLELFDENKIIASLPKKIKLLEEYLEKIAVLPFVGNVRNAGMMAGVEIVKDKGTKQSFENKYQVGAKLCAIMRDNGAMMRPLSDVIVIMPPVAIDIETLRKLLDIVYETLQNELPELTRII